MTKTEMYCLKCKKKQTVIGEDKIIATTRGEKCMFSGTCQVCGSKVSRFKKIEKDQKKN